MTEILVWILGTFTIVFAVTVLVLLVFFYRTMQKVGKLESRIDELKIENMNLRNRPVTKIVYSINKPKLETRGYIDCSFSDEKNNNNGFVDTPGNIKLDNEKALEKYMETGSDFGSKKNNNGNNDDNKDNSDSEKMYDIIETQGGNNEVVHSDGGSLSQWTTKEVDNKDMPCSNPRLFNEMTSLQKEGWLKNHNNNTDNNNNNNNNNDNNMLPSSITPQLRNQITTLGIEGHKSTKLSNNNLNEANENGNNMIREWSCETAFYYFSFLVNQMNDIYHIHDESEMNQVLQQLKQDRLNGSQLQSIFKQPKHVQRQTIEDKMSHVQTPLKNQLITEVLKLNCKT